jgi:hypothetical protein
MEREWTRTEETEEKRQKKTDENKTTPPKRFSPFLPQLSGREKGFPDESTSQKHTNDRLRPEY